MPDGRADAIIEQNQPQGDAGSFTYRWTRRPPFGSSIGSAAAVGQS